MNSIINKAKDGYLKAVDWIATNPQKAGWASLAAVALALVM